VFDSTFVGIVRLQTKQVVSVDPFRAARESKDAGGAGRIALRWCGAAGDGALVCVHEFSEDYRSLASRDGDLKLCARKSGHQLAWSRDDLHIHDQDVDRGTKRRRRVLD
jgi:hypothetical protein